MGPAVRPSPSLAAAIVLVAAVGRAASAQAQAAATSKQPADEKPAAGDKAAPAPTGGAAAPAPAHGAAREGVAGSENGTAAAAEPDGVALSIGAWLGGSYRVDDPPAHDPLERGGLTLGAGAALWPASWLGIAIGFEHTDLGAERASLPESTFDVERDLNTLWGTLRLAPWSTGAVPYLAFGPGLAWQSLDASGTVLPFPQGTTAVTLRCEGSASASLALRLAGGVEGRFDNGMVFFAEGGADMIRLDDAPLDGCAAGAGTAMLLGLRAGAQYRFDVTRSVR
jgi:hypothetical protein